MVWVVLVDVVVVLVGLVALGLIGWQLVVRPGLDLGRAVAGLGEQLGRAADGVASAARGHPDGPSGRTST